MEIMTFDLVIHGIIAFFSGMGGVLFVYGTYAYDLDLSDMSDIDDIPHEQ